MGWGWRRAGVLGVGLLLLLGAFGTLFRPAAAGEAPSQDSFLKAEAHQRAEKIRLAAQVAVILGSAALRSGADSDGSGSAMVASLSRSALFAPASDIPSPSPPSWAAVAAVAPLAVMALLAFNRRPVPSLQLAGPLFSMATVQGPPPPLLSPFLRVVAMGLMGLALVSGALFDLLLMSATGLLLFSLLIDPGASRRSLRGSVNVL